MKLNLKGATVCGAVAAVAIGVLAYRQLRPSTSMPPEPSIVLSATPAEDGGTEPVRLPAEPILRNSASEPGRLAIAFGYKVGAASYAYTLAVSFPGEADQGTMDLGLRHAGAADVDQFPVTRRWSESRQAYLIAVGHDFAKPVGSVPNLCIRAVVGPRKESLDLQRASLCVMQRDQDGRCHAATLACGEIR